MKRRNKTGQFIEGKKVQKACLKCHKTFSVHPYRKKTARFCSASCGVSFNFIDEKSNGWKGENVGYVALHTWIARKLGKPRYCAYCQNEKLNHRQYHWANISHAYKRDLSDWIRLCVRCHSAYDAGRIKL